MLLDMFGAGACGWLVTLLLLVHMRPLGLGGRARTEGTVLRAQHVRRDDLVRMREPAPGVGGGVFWPFFCRTFRMEQKHELLTVVAMQLVWLALGSMEGSVGSKTVGAEVLVHTNFPHDTGCVTPLGAIETGII